MMNDRRQGNECECMPDSFDDIISSSITLFSVNLSMLTVISCVNSNYPSRMLNAGGESCSRSV